MHTGSRWSACLVRSKATTERGYKAAASSRTGREERRGRRFPRGKEKKGVVEGDRSVEAEELRAKARRTTSSRQLGGLEKPSEAPPNCPLRFLACAPSARPTEARACKQNRTEALPLPHAASGRYAALRRSCCTNGAASGCANTSDCHEKSETKKKRHKMLLCQNTQNDENCK